MTQSNYYLYVMGDLLWLIGHVFSVIYLCRKKQKLKTKRIKHCNSIDVFLIAKFPQRSYSKVGVKNSNVCDPPSPLNSKGTRMDASE